MARSGTLNWILALGVTAVVMAPLAARADCHKCLPSGICSSDDYYRECQFGFSSISDWQNSINGGAVGPVPEVGAGHSEGGNQGRNCTSIKDPSCEAIYWNGGYTPVPTADDPGPPTPSSDDQINSCSVSTNVCSADGRGEYL